MKKKLLLSTLSAAMSLSLLAACGVDNNNRMNDADGVDYRPVRYDPTNNRGGFDNNRGIDGPYGDPTTPTQFDTDRDNGRDNRGILNNDNNRNNRGIFNNDDNGRNNRGILNNDDNGRDNRGILNNDDNGRNNRGIFNNDDNDGLFNGNDNDNNVRGTNRGTRPGNAGITDGR